MEGEGKSCTVETKRSLAGCGGKGTAFSAERAAALIEAAAKQLEQNGASPDDVEKARRWLPPSIQAKNSPRAIATKPKSAPRTAAAIEAAAAASSVTGARSSPDAAAAQADAAAPQAFGSVWRIAAGGSGGSGGSDDDGALLAAGGGGRLLPCPLKTKAPVLNGCARDGALQKPERGLTLREQVSLLLVASQHHELWLQLGPDALGFSVSPLLKDVDVTRLCEWAYGYEPETLGPGGSQGFAFRNSILDTPSRYATQQFSALLLRLRDLHLLHELDGSTGPLEQIARGQFLLMFEGAGHGPRAPERNGWVQLGSSPALTEALGNFMVHAGVTVGQSVAEVASEVDGVIRDSQGRVAAPCYQPRASRLGAEDGSTSGGFASGALLSGGKSAAAAPAFVAVNGDRSETAEAPAEFHGVSGTQVRLPSTSCISLSCIDTRVKAALLPNKGLLIVKHSPEWSELWGRGSMSLFHLSDVRIACCLSLERQIDVPIRSDEALRLPWRKCCSLRELSPVRTRDHGSGQRVAVDFQRDAAFVEQDVHRYKGDLERLPLLPLGQTLNFINTESATGTGLDNFYLDKALELPFTRMLLGVRSLRQQEDWRQRRLALMQALHRRLGSCSPLRLLRRLPPSVLQRIVQGLLPPLGRTARIGDTAS